MWDFRANGETPELSADLETSDNVISEDMTVKVLKYDATGAGFLAVKRIMLRLLLKKHIQQLS